MQRKIDRRTFLKVAGGAVLVGALAGCGSVTGGKRLTTQDVVDFLNETMESIGRDLRCTNTEETERMAKILLETAQKNSELEKNKSVLDLLTSEEALQAAQIDPSNETYRVNVSVNPDSMGMMSLEERKAYVVDSLARNSKVIGKDKMYTEDIMNVGVVFGKIGQMEYIVLLQDGNSRKAA